MPQEFTNVGRSLIMVAGKRFAPGDTWPVEDKFIEGVKKCSNYRAGRLKEGRVTMQEPAPRARPEALPEDRDKALSYIKLEDQVGILQKWATAENGGPNRKEVMAALQSRAMELSNVPPVPPAPPSPTPHG